MARFSYKDASISEEIQQEICPLTVTQNAIAGRWKIVILWHLSQNEMIRFNELLKMLPGISKGILTRQLRELEVDELVHREVYKVVPPKVEYSLTELGQKFIPVLEAMQVWGKDLLNKKIEMYEKLED
ncbi:winged helix-turn-helix transcriptional regulator [Cytobacillus citreus]|uniref:winged helix-turn-helix transcriptional regulator n=1 Tax=Cytobacillus citreus TaxID=2833586 RepID=UPI002016C49B|nr:helix-turn-helix domain-containing protein [Cytobacillus citreus]